MAEEVLRAQILAASALRPPPLVALTYIQHAVNSSFARPVWLECDDETVYVVKGINAGRSIFNDHVVGILGAHLGAPVPRSALVNIPAELVQAEPGLSHIVPGVGHGTEWVRNTSDRQWLSYTDPPYNRSRFAHLAIMYGWLCAGDHQLIYSNHDPYLVWSVDHGHFLPGGPDWTIPNLQNVPDAAPYQEIVLQCALSEVEMAGAAAALARVADDAIISAVAIAPEEWGVSLEERLALAIMMIQRRDAMLVACGQYLGG